MKKIKYILPLLLIIILIPFINNNEIKDDYYNYINKNTIKNHKLAEDKSTWNTFQSKQEMVDKRKDEIIKELINNKTNNNLNIIYNQLLDNNTRNKEGLSNIGYYLKLIDNTSNINDYINIIPTIENDLNIDLILNIKVDSDFKNTSKNIIYLYPITMDFGANSDFYINDDYMTYKALIKQYGIKILKVYGYDTKKARNISREITNMYIDISNNSYQSNDLEDISKYYNIISKEELQKIYTNIDIDNYLKK